MNQTEFEKLCRQIADVPWGFGPYAAWAGSKIEYYRDSPEITIRLSDGLDLLRITFAAAPSPKQIATARSFFGDLELEYIAREIAPNAPWVFVNTWAHIQGRWPTVERFPTHFSIQIRNASGFVDSIEEDTSAGLIAAYREHRAKHEAARGVKTRQPKPQPKPQALWYPPDFNDLTVEHARNIVACLANPDKYTRIAQWARVSPTTRQRVLSRALETK